MKSFNLAIYCNWLQLYGCLENEDRIPADGGCGWENADRKMRMEKMQITKKVRGKKTRNADGKKIIINKHN